MTKKSSGTMEKSRESKPKLRCPDCGNSDYFIEIMDFESHLVTGHLNYVRLLDAVTDYYLCHGCGSKRTFDGTGDLRHESNHRSGKRRDNGSIRSGVWCFGGGGRV